MDEIYLLAAVRYVERNPVAAGLCEDPHCWQWSSAMAHVKGKSDGVVDVKPMLDRVDNWHNYLAGNTTPDQEAELIKRHARTGRPLGSKAFVNKLESVTNRPLLPRKAGRKPAMDICINCPRNE
jgi:putative transposase